MCPIWTWVFCVPFGYWRVKLESCLCGCFDSTQECKSGFRVPLSEGKTRNGSVKDTFVLFSPSISSKLVKRTELVHTFEKIYKFTIVLWFSALKKRKNIWFGTQSCRCAVEDFFHKSHFIDTMVPGISSIILLQINLLNGLACESFGKKRTF